MTTLWSAVALEAAAALTPFRQPRRLAARLLDLIALGCVLVAFAAVGGADPSPILVLGLVAVTGVSSFQRARADRTHVDTRYRRHIAVIEGTTRALLVALCFVAVAVLTAPVQARGIRPLDALLLAWAVTAAGAFLTRRSTARWLANQLGIGAVAVFVAMVVGPTPHPVIPGGIAIAGLLGSTALLIRYDTGAWPSLPQGRERGANG